MAQIGSYDWAKLLDGNEHKLVRTVNYSCSSTSFRAYAYQQARARGLKLKVAFGGNPATGEEFVVIQAYVAVAANQFRPVPPPLESPYQPPRFYLPTGVVTSPAPPSSPSAPPSPTAAADAR